jgi:glycosyltransferase involved in cell wall biosynthesis
MISVYFTVIGDNEFLFSCFEDFLSKTDIVGLDINFIILYYECGEAFKNSLEHLQSIVPNLMLQNKKITDLQVDNETINLYIEPYFKIKEINSSWLKECINLFETIPNLYKINLNKKGTYPYILKNVNNHKKVERLYSQGIFKKIQLEDINILNRFDNRININCHIPVLVIHNSSKTSKILFEETFHTQITTFFNKFKHSFLRFLHFFANETSVQDINKVITKYEPKAILTIDMSRDICMKLCMTFLIRKKWINFDNYDLINIPSVENCIFSSFDHSLENDYPLISIITPTYESKHRIFRPYKSLLDQTYTNWEWILIDDSKTENTWKDLQTFAEADFRIRIYKRASNDGYIGKNKLFCSSLAKGKLIFELDHDDDLTTDALETLVKAYKKYPEAGFFYSDCIECDEPNINDYCHPFNYGDYFSFGYGAYYRQWRKNVFQYVAKASRMNPNTFRHIVGVPNHFRCWTKKAYVDVGGHNDNLSVGDDYDLILRTMFKYRWVHITKALYIQYRNTGGSNFTFYRNKLIQYLVKHLTFLHENKIHNRLLEFNVPDLEHDRYTNRKIPNDYKVLNFEYPILEHVYNIRDTDPNNPCISIVIPTYNRPNDLEKALNSIFEQTHQNFEIFLIGDCCPHLDNFLVYYYKNSRDDRLKWFNLQENNGPGGAVPRNYALKMLCSTKWIAYLDDDNVWKPDHLESLIKCTQENPDASYVFSSMLIDDKEIFFKEQPRKGRIDTNCIMHTFDLLVKHGLWKNRIEGGYAHDWEFISRWKDEKYAFTGKCTVVYNTLYNNQSYEQIMSM